MLKHNVYKKKKVFFLSQPFPTSMMVLRLTELKPILASEPAWVMQQSLNLILPFHVLVLNKFSLTIQT